MCAPALSAVAGIGVAVLQAGAQYQAQKADYAAKSAAWTQNVVNSEAAARDEQRQIISQMLIQQDKDVQAQHISFIEQAQKQSTIAVNASDHGVDGPSVDHLLNDIAGKSEQNRSYMDENYRNVVADTQMKLTSSTDQEEARINSAPYPVAPSPLAGYATIAGAGIKAYGAVSNPTGSMGDT